MKLKNLKKEKGITLIALIVTIIVMLILVAVSITMAVNGGLFDYAKKAKDATQYSIDEERMLGEALKEVEKGNYPSIDAYYATKRIGDNANFPKLGKEMKAVYWEEKEDEEGKVYYEEIEEGSEKFKLENWYKYGQQNRKRRNK